MRSTKSTQEDISGYSQTTFLGVLHYYHVLWCDGDAHYVLPSHPLNPADYGAQKVLHLGPLLALIRGSGVSADQLDLAIWPLGSVDPGS